MRVADRAGHLEGKVAWLTGVNCAASTHAYLRRQGFGYDNGRLSEVTRFRTFDPHERNLHDDKRQWWRIDDEI